MRAHLILAATGAFTILLAQASRADAGPAPTHFTDQAAFISHATFLEADTMFVPPGPMPEPFTVGSLTLATGGHNIAYAQGSAPFAPILDAFASNTHTPIDGVIGDVVHAGPYDLFGFWIGNLVGLDLTDVTLMFASGQTYSTVVTSMPIQQGVQFQGFLAPQGEFFTGFSLSAHGIDTRLAATAFIFGTTACQGFNCASDTPEPASWALMILGFGVVGGAVRARRAGEVRPAA